MIVAGHHDGGLEPTWQIPEPRNRLAIGVHELDHVRQQALLLIGLGDGHFRKIHPVGLAPAEEQIIRADGGLAVTFLAGPRRISLTRVDDRPREVVRERRHLTS